MKEHEKKAIHEAEKIVRKSYHKGIWRALYWPIIYMAVGAILLYLLWLMQPHPLP